MSEDWHGMSHDELEARGGEVPELPGAGADDTAERGHSRRYAHVHFTGNYGALCGQYQEFDRYDVDANAVRQIAWSAFGTCGHSMTYYDEDGNEIGP